MKPIGLNIKCNNAYINKHSLYDLAKQYKTPLYIMDEAQLIKNIHEYLNYFKEVRLIGSSLGNSTGFIISNALIKKPDTG